MSRDLAIALGYEPGTDLAPRVLATGKGLLAERIRAIADHHGIPVREDEELAGLLARIPLHEEIPKELYPAVAEILAYLYRLSGVEL